MYKYSLEICLKFENTVRPDPTSNSIVREQFKNRITAIQNDLNEEVIQSKNQAIFEFCRWSNQLDLPTLKIMLYTTYPYYYYYILINH